MFSKQEIDYHRNKTNVNLQRDKFVSIMSDFISVATYNFSELEDLFNDMKDKVKKINIMILKTLSSDI